MTYPHTRAIPLPAYVIILTSATDEVVYSGNHILDVINEG